MLPLESDFLCDLMLELYALQMSILQRFGRTCDRFFAIL